MNPPKPHALHIAEGSFRKDRHGSPDEIVYADGDPSPVRKLTGEALKFWNRVVPDLVSMKVAATVDSDALTQMAECHALVLSAHEKVQENPIGRSERTSYLAYLAEWGRWAGRFGMTPSDRARLRVEKPKKSGLEQKYG